MITLVRVEFEVGIFSRLKKMKSDTCVRKMHLTNHNYDVIIACEYSWLRFTLVYRGSGKETSSSITSVIVTRCFSFNLKAEHESESQIKVESDNNQ